MNLMVYAWPIGPWTFTPIGPARRYTPEEAAAKVFGEREPCPHCDDRGFFVVSGTRAAHACGGDDSRCQVVCPVQEAIEEQEQCPCGARGES